uniref:RNA helicase n=1 Tax=Heterorhabditis bacteriophora TaxID=37862 RepID=A0A1I7WXV1_HETBA
MYLLCFMIQVIWFGATKDGFGSSTGTDRGSGFGRSGRFDNNREESNNEEGLELLRTALVALQERIVGLVLVEVEDSIIIGEGTTMVGTTVPVETIDLEEECYIVVRKILSFFLFFTLSSRDEKSFERFEGNRGFRDSEIALILFQDLHLIKVEDSVLYRGDFATKTRVMLALEAVVLEILTLGTKDLLTKGLQVVRQERMSLVLLKIEDLVSLQKDFAIMEHLAKLLIFFGCLNVITHVILTGRNCYNCGGTIFHMTTESRQFSFDDVYLTERIRQNVTQAGYSRPTPIQQFAMPTEDLSNSGERPCSPRCIIIAPTRELAVQIYNEGRKFAHNTVMYIACIYGGTSVALQTQSLTRVCFFCLRCCFFKWFLIIYLQGATILVATTGRLKHFLEEDIISFSKVKYVVLDEADRMLDLGFGDDINYVMNYPSMTPKEQRQTLMFSLSANKCITQVILQHALHFYITNIISFQEIIKCQRSEKRDKLLNLLNVDLETYTADRGLIHNYSRRNCLVLVLFLATLFVYRTGRVGNAGRATSFYVSETDSALAPHLVEILSQAEQVRNQIKSFGYDCNTFSR